MDDIAPMIVPQCGTCHAAGGGMAGLDMTSYAGAIQGGTSGPAVVPGDPAASLLVQRQQAGDHPGQITSEELARVIAWIEAGAPE
jgi:mono/diheme cytochrome c family protein